MKKKQLKYGKETTNIIGCSLRRSEYNLPAEMNKR